jgi:phage terminase large subunit GpA-like protein
MSDAVAEKPAEATALSWWHVLPRPLQISIRKAAAAGLASLRAPEPMTLDQWAERWFYLSAESSQGEQRWESYPFQRALLCMMGDDHIEELNLRKSARVGYSKMLLASIAYDAAHKRRAQCLWQPTDDDSDEFCKAEIEPMLRDVEAVRAEFPDFNRKNKFNTLNFKKFRHAALYLKGGKSAGNFRRMTLQSAKLDEFDGFDQKIEGSSDPWTLAYKRLEGATFPKLIAGTTPRRKGSSHIEKREVVADVRMRFQVPCKHCGVEHPLQWGGKHVRWGMKWDKEDPEKVRHHCPHCLAPMMQADYLQVWTRGAWVSDDGLVRCEAGPDHYRWTDASGEPLLRPPRHVATHIWSAYSPQTTWAAIVRQFLACMRAKEAGDKAPLEGFVNETLGETWEDEADKTDAGELVRRAEDYPLRVVPEGGLELVTGVDTQDDRWELVTYAVGRDEEAWCVDYAVLYGNPADEEEWESKVGGYLRQPFTHANGAAMTIRGMAVDTGGHFTHQAYAFCRQHQADRVFAIAGDPKADKPIKSRASWQDVNFRGRTLKKGVRLWKVGTDTAKDLIFGRLKLEIPAPGQRRKGCLHLSKHLPQEFFTGLVAEVRRTVRTARGTASRWVKRSPGVRNEPLDCTVYAVFASHALDHHKLSEAQWARLEAAIAVAPLPAPAASLPPLAPGEVQIIEPEAKQEAVKVKRSRIGPASATHNPYASEEWLSRLK